MLFKPFSIMLREPSCQTRIPLLQHASRHVWICCTLFKPPLSIVLASGRVLVLYLLILGIGSVVHTESFLKARRAQVGLSTCAFWIEPAAQRKSRCSTCRFLTFLPFKTPTSFQILSVQFLVENRPRVSNF